MPPHSMDLYDTLRISQQETLSRATLTYIAWVSEMLRARKTTFQSDAPMPTTQKKFWKIGFLIFERERE